MTSILNAFRHHVNVNLASPPRILNHLQQKIDIQPSRISPAPSQLSTDSSIPAEKQVIEEICTGHVCYPFSQYQFAFIRNVFLHKLVGHSHVGITPYNSVITLHSFHIGQAFVCTCYQIYLILSIIISTRHIYAMLIILRRKTVRIRRRM